MHLAVGVAERPVVGRLAAPVVGVDARCAACSLKCSTVSASPSASMPHSSASSASVARLLQPPALEQLRGEVARGGIAGGRSACGSGRRRSASTARPGSSCRARTWPCPPPCTSSTRSRTAARRRRRRSCGAAGGPGRASTGRSGRCGATGSHHASSISVGLRAEPHRGGDRLAGVAGVGHRPLALVGLLAAVLLAHLAVVGEAAGGDQHALAGPDRAPARRRARCARRRPGRPRRSGPRAGPRSTPGCPRSTAMAEHLPDERRAVGEQRLAAGPWRRAVRSTTRAEMAKAADAAVVVRQRPGLVGHHRQAEALRQPGLQLRQPRAELLARPTAPARCRGRRRGRPSGSSSSRCSRGR